MDHTASPFSFVVATASFLCCVGDDVVGTIALAPTGDAWIATAGDRTYRTYRTDCIGNARQWCAANAILPTPPPVPVLPSVPSDYDATADYDAMVADELNTFADAMLTMVPTGG